MSPSDSEVRPPVERAFLGMPAEITSRLATESDRGAILILAAYIEEILGLIVRAACINDKEADDILEFRGPAGGFDLKIRLCSALGLIHSEEVRRLRAVQKIRNRAAHFDKKSGFDVLFDKEQTAALVRNLDYDSNGEQPTGTAGEIRNLFVGRVRRLATQLYFRLFAISRPPELQSARELAQEVRERHKGSGSIEAFNELEQEARAGNPEKLREFMGVLLSVIKDGTTS